ncbi:hypothetical protein CR513_62271, partial [Mucuna pruriens]
MPVTRNQASSTNEGEEDTLQRLLRAVATLQERSDEQSRLNAEAEQRHAEVEQRHAEAEERHKLVEERHSDALKAAEKREEELRWQIEALKATREQDPEEPEEVITPPFWGQPFCKEIDETAIPPNFREVVVEPFDGSQDPHAHLQAFQTQMYISGGSDKFSCKLFLGTLRGVAMQWMAMLPPRSVQTFQDLASSFLSQFAANKVKRLEVVDLFDVRQAEGESLKRYLARFNNATVRVDDPDQKFFVKAFQKGLRTGPFSDALALRKPTNMEEIRARAEKHVEMEEDQLERRRSERKTERKETKVSSKIEEDKRPLLARAREQAQHFTPLNEKRAQIMHEIRHTSLLEYPPEARGKVMGRERSSWCDFHRAYDHTTEDYWGLSTQIENHRLASHKDKEGNRATWPEQAREKGVGTPAHRGTISTISGGRTADSWESMSWTNPGRPGGRVQTVLTGANATPLGERKSTPPITFDDRDMRSRASSQDEPMVISMVVAGYKVERVLIDQGSSANVLYRSTLKKMQLSTGLIQACPGNLYGFAGECVPILGTVELETCLGERPVTRTIQIRYTIVDAPASYNIIVGRPALNRLGAIVSTKHLCMKFPIGRQVGSIWADTQVARKCYEDSLRIERLPSPRIMNVLDLDLDPRSQFVKEGPLPAEELKEVKLGSDPEQTTKIGTTMSAQEEEVLVAVLKSNYDVFAWSTQDMPGVDPNFMCHWLSLDDQARPVAQKKRKMGEEKRKAAKQETRKLLSAGFIREVQYPTWLANVVMVRKANGKWRMCTDYTDLNKACPKDSYPLPSIDRLVDNVAGYTFLSFMDAYSGYNQIRMHPQDGEKTTFITDEGAFCYQVMPFGLKNAGATYQRLMDKIFKGILGRDVEVYVDDMVARSQCMREHCKALGRIFDVLRKHQLRLNPVKCSFGVKTGKFLGFMLTERGIEANPEKCQAITNVRSPKSIKEVQQFMGKVTALARFISKSAEMSTPLFATLKKGGKFARMSAKKLSCT